MNLRYAFVLACIVTNALVGCGSFKSFVAKDADMEDPLRVVNSETSEAYKAAKVQLDDAAAGTVLKFARWREDLGDYAEAKSRYQDVLSDSPDNVEARLGIARVELTTGQKAEATKILEATVRKHPESTVAWVALGRLHVKQQDYPKAIVSFRKAVKTEPANRVANYELGVALARDNQLDDAHRHLTVAGGESAAYYNIGYLLNEDGRSAESSSWLQKALDSKPDENTRASAVQLMATLGRAANQNTMVASQAPPVVIEGRSRYEKYTESPGRQGFETAPSLKVSRQEQEAMVSAAPRGAIERTPMEAQETGGVQSASLHWGDPAAQSSGSTQQTQWSGPGTAAGSHYRPVSATGPTRITTPTQWEPNR